ncbi:MAG TPA: suppressor of fused domain protein [Stellaceae bacterium]|nr:suppressor of fused domain protein [Stellaceae bacterium]
MSNEERSPSGAPIHRHQLGNPEPQPAEHASPHGERLEAHLTRFLGEPSSVLHEIVSEVVHIDVNVYPPRGGRDFLVLVSHGMSRLPMAAPEGRSGYRWAELMLCLPPDWPIDDEAIKDDRNYWPLRWLRMLAGLPHRYQTWLSLGHTIPNRDPPRPFAANTSLCCWLLVPPALFGEDFPKVALPEGETLHLYNLVPIHRSEMEFKLQHGAEMLTERLWKAGGVGVMDVAREPAC